MKISASINTMSRLIVKNLPKSITVDKLKETFSSEGTITDVQLKYTKDGKFRQFGFVGYKSEEEGKAALEYFNNTFLNASKITVELCADLGDPNKPKSWSKYASDSSAGKSKTSGNDKTQEKEVTKKEKGKKEENDISDIINKHKDDPLFAEYLETHLKSKKAAWSNDAELDNEKLAKILSKKSMKDGSKWDASDISQEDKGRRDGSEGSDQEKDSTDDEEANEMKESEDENDYKVSLANEDISDFEYLQKLKGIQTVEKGEPEKADVAKNKAKKEPIELFTVKIRGLGCKARKSHVRHFFHPIKPYSIRLPPRIKGIAYVGFRTEREMKQALGKNKGFLAGRQIMVNKYEEKDSKEAGEQDKSSWKWKDQEESLRNEETIGESGRIFVRNLAYTVTMEDVEALFSKYGPVVEVNVPVDWMTRKPKGFGTITFMIPEHAVKAFSELDGKAFHGRMLHLLPGKAKPEEDESLEGLTYKQKKEKKLKNQAKSSHNWNTLFLGHNAVADAIAKAYDTTKEKVLDSSSGNSVAVRLALGETQLVSKTREFLLENGVSLGAFDQAPKKRSKTVLLVKNLPAGTEPSELREIFEKHALLGRIVLPPSGLTAIIEFSDPTEARNTFRKLAYTKFKNVPLYLEWAPEDTFTTPSSIDANKDKSIQEGNGENWCIDTKPEEAIEEEIEDEEEPESDATLFVKNLNFDTKEDDLIEHFKKCGKIQSATIAKKKDVRRPGELLSMGFGFVQFMKKASAEKALKTLQNSTIHGHAVELKRSNRSVQSDVATARKKSTAGKQAGSKILVRNIPFEATVKEVTELFQTFGDLKSVRLPKKLVGTGSHRGFGFVEFLTKSDAKQAFKALSFSTHLYGRRLVLEWASNEEDVDELRKRTAEHFIESAPKRSNKSVLSTEDRENE